MLTEGQLLQYERLIELEAEGNLSVSGEVKLDDLRTLLRLENRSLTGRTPGEPQPQFVTSAPRQAGKNHQHLIDEAIQAAHYDPARQEYLMPDGTVLTTDTLANMNQTQLKHQAFLNQQAIGRPLKQPYILPHDEQQLVNNTIVAWTSKGRFRYVAIWANAKWHITGDGSYYGSNYFTHDDFINRVVGDAEVSNLEIVSDLSPLEMRP